MVLLQNDENRKFVSRGGVKLQAALSKFKVEVKGLVVLDVGSSTGGFVDCLLQNGAKKVYSVDTCYGELAWKLRNDSKVVVMERTNVLHLDRLPSGHSGEPATPESSSKERSWTSQDDNGKVDLITIDAGWTKLELVLPVVEKFLKPNGAIIALLKPQYEAQGLLLRNEAQGLLLRNEAGKQFKGGVVPEDQVEEIKNKVLQAINDLQFTINDVMESPILGGAGNQEFLLKITAN